jgi:hypothetical protein
MIGMLGASYYGEYGAPGLGVLVTPPVHARRVKSGGKPEKRVSSGVAEERVSGEEE